MIYWDLSNGFWEKRDYDDKGNLIYCECSDDSWFKLEYDANDNPSYSEHSDGYWYKYDRDSSGDVIYMEDSRDGVTIDKRSCSDIVFIDEQTGKKFKMTEVE